MSASVEKQVRELGLTVQFTFRTTKDLEWACRIFKPTQKDKDTPYYEGFGHTQFKALRAAVRAWALDPSQK